jgi:hypothetical protein
MSVKRIKDIEDHLERFEARYDRMIRLEALRVRKAEKKRLIRLSVAAVSLGCPGYALFCFLFS